jgi:LuxR family maltose regulon positive regulatory protein
MATPVLATKLFLPLPRQNAVPRVRLIERLQEGLDAGNKLTLVSAPAGFGKSTLLSEWLAVAQQGKARVGAAWVSLDEGDIDPARFLFYLVAAVDGAVAGSEPSPLAVHTGPPLSVEESLTGLLNDVAKAPFRIIVVLDDFQRIDTAESILAFLLDHLPPNMHLAIASRVDPPLPLARLRSRGELTELRAADLRFTSEESATFLNRVMGLGLTAEDIAALEARTEGWIAGLQLAALSLRQHPDIPGFIRAFTGSHRFVIDYLGEEVLQSQPDDIRTFLSQTAFLDRFNGSLCDAVTGRANSAEILESLERRNLFVVPLDDRREWYRYHHLFADVIQARSIKDNPTQLKTLHRLASEWHEHNELPEDAIRHALAAADFDRAAWLIEREMPDIRRSRQDKTLLGWLEQLPPDAAADRPVLNVYYAWSMLVAGDLDAAERRLDDAERALETGAQAGSPAHLSADGEELRTLPVMISVYRASSAQARGDVGGTTRHARRALELTQPNDHFGRGAAAGFLGLALWAGGAITEAVTTFAEARSSLRLAGNTADVLGSAVVLADMLVVAGRQREARRTFDEALQLATAQGHPVPQATADLHVGVSELDSERQELESALERLELAKALGELASLPENRHRWFIAMSRIREAQGALDGALCLLEEAEQLYLPGLLPETRPIAAMKARVWIKQGKLVDAQAWAERRGLSVTDAASYLHEFEHITLARLLMARYRVDHEETDIGEAVDLLERLSDAADAASRTGSSNEILMLQALAHQARGHTALALVPFSQALIQCEPEGHIRLFADEGEPMLTLLKEAAKQNVVPGYVHRLRSAFGSVESPASAAHPEIEPLSERELQVLRLLSSELSGPQIARELFVSLNTLRTHTSHIFDKLSVNSRVVAVRRARDLGLI